MYRACKVSSESITYTLYLIYILIIEAAHLVPKAQWEGKNP